MQELEKAQAEAREQELLNLDWRCWKRLADEGYFQRAEDDLMAAARLEQERNGNSDRYASLLYALAALYDKRSFDDVTGQSTALSLTSAQVSIKGVWKVVAGKLDKVDCEIRETKRSIWMILLWWKNSTGGTA